MKNLTVTSLTLAAVFAAVSAFAQTYTVPLSDKNFADAALAYDSGKSMAWYYSAYALAQQDPEFTENEILGIINSKQLSYESLRLCCKLLKQSASEKSINHMLALIGSGIAPELPCEVLLAINSDAADKALRDALEANKSNAKIRNEILVTLGKRNKAENIPAMMAFAKSQSDANVAKIAITAIGQIDSSESVDALVEILQAGFAPQNRDCLYDALCQQAQFDLRQPGFFNFRAKKALKSVSKDFPSSIGLRAELMNSSDRVEYLDSLIIKGADLAKIAGKYNDCGRTFEDSEALIKAYPKLPDTSKMIAIRSFMQSEDPAFYDVFKADVDSSNRDLRRTAIFAMRFLCSENKEAIEKLMSLTKDADKDIAHIAADILTEIKGPLADNLMKDKPDFAKIMILRGSQEHLKALWQKFFTDAGLKDRELNQMVEQTLMWHDMRAFAEHLNQFSKKEYRMAIAKVLVKKIALLRDKTNMTRIASEVLKGLVSKDDAVAKFVSSKLKINLDGLD